MSVTNDCDKAETADAPDAPPGPRVLVHTRRDRELAAATWLLLAAPDSTTARYEWNAYGLALLRCGGLFSAVRIPAGLVHAAAGTETREGVATFLTDALAGGAVFHDAGGRQYYALTPASTARMWRLTEAECLGEDAFLGVPATDLTAPDPRCTAHWVVPMAGPAALCMPGDVARLVLTARDLAATRHQATHPATADRRSTRGNRTNLTLPPLRS
ncbi:MULTISPECIES: hypothetical protein [Streptomyces]|uniref:Uncharacterized protein n=1 Tax=Streptomyces solicathayae TaxID=3081768 RepID=A0ABZ0M4R5_9ACTN|nr:hypothetical protein [Streptomyces sp. HUAS YS2]WOX26421.1 hypothetical protein R2D22_35625 [Streptomyces sp. HUAS YS2]